MPASHCPFCNVKQDQTVAANDVAFALPDAFPVTEGHTLVIPKRHVMSLFELSEVEQAEVWRLVTAVRNRLMDELVPDGFNIGVNDGAAAGQTVMHAHVHIIPRHSADVEDARGGMRRVMPKKAKYW
jgi:diadenosine tetraphosphate (Ap4A) HIT family hydrolase